MVPGHPAARSNLKLARTTVPSAVNLADLSTSTRPSLRTTTANRAVSTTPATAVTNTAGSALIYKGNGKGGFLPGIIVVSRSRSAYTDILTPLLLDRRRQAQTVVARKAKGKIWLIAGDGKGGFPGAWRRVGTGWQGFSEPITRATSPATVTLT